ncbi:MAG: CAAX prenyl protease-related protein [Planctomycetia bacterium]|nr:CAAX prenyl protease-related protein [Planctomycetia bacterium]
MSVPETAETSWKPFLAYVLPFLFFGVFTSLEGLESLKGYFTPIYEFKVVAVLGALWWGRRYYPAWSWNGAGLGLLAGIVGGIIWIVLCKWNFEQLVLPGIVAKLAEWFNIPDLVEWIKPASRTAYQPFADGADAAAYGFLLIRLIGMVVAVPIMEELFWRGFLIRIIIDERWQQVPLGKLTRASVIIVTLAFVAVHAEWTAALVWILMIHWLYWKTRNLWACVIAHAASNAVLAGYILAYEQWQLW